jgi:Arc/MetJ-type ribon-helix-helix transcriptional regulator
MDQKIVAVKLVSAELEALDQLVLLKGFASRSAAIRAGLGLLFEQSNMTRVHEQKIETQRKRHQPRDRGTWGKGFTNDTDLVPAFSKKKEQKK